jgi:hypothetical protein
MVVTGLGFLHRAGCAIVYPWYTTGIGITQEMFLVPFLRDYLPAGVSLTGIPMNPSKPSLPETMREWQVTPPADPNFRSRVWRKIRARQPDNWPTYLRGHVVAWSLAAVLTLGAAALAGHATAQARVRSDRAAMVVSYLVELDPRVQVLLKP